MNKFTLEKVNKGLIFVAILALLYRVGNFSVSHTPKPFEFLLFLISIIFVIDMLKNKKVKDFFLSIPKNILWALIALVSSILIGWTISTTGGIPTTFNMILEFATFTFSLGIFVFILFYTRKDENYAKKYFYALLVPIIYIPFVFFPELAYKFGLALGTHFVGFTTNPNIVSKILIIPIIFFSVKTLFEEKNNLLKLGYFLLASFLSTILFWTSSRGGLISLILGLVIVWLVFSLKDFSWKKLLNSGVTLFIIYFVGFSIASYGLHSSLLSRISNTSTDETRLKIWSFYLKRVLVNPVGYGPNTHMESHIMLSNGQYENTGPHNTLLQIWLWGGLLGLLSSVYLIFCVFRKMKERLRNEFNPITVSILSIFFSLLLAIMFDDSLSFYWFFIILALALRK